MEDKLKALISRIEQSSLSPEEKAQLYATVSTGLQASIWPTIMQYVPKDKMDAIVAMPKDQLSAIEFAKLIESSILDGKALVEIDDVMNKLLDEIDAALKEEHI
jgi:hypothetical protein